jgi:hypothetical protein
MLQRNGQRDTQANYRERMAAVTSELPTFTVYSQRYWRGWLFGALDLGLLASSSSSGHLHSEPRWL